VARTWSEVEVLRLAYDDSAGRELRGYGGKLRMAEMVTALANDAERTGRIAALLQRLVADGRCVLGLSERVAHLHALRDAVVAAAPAMRDSIGVLTGETADRAQQAARPLLLATYPLCRQGFDKPELDTLVMLTPITSIEQSVGRILRAHPSKQTPLVVDIVDPYSIFLGERRKRHRQYEEQGYSVRDDLLSAASAFSTPSGVVS
jgi:superfamily II DNA or RNA helicase